MAGTTRLSFDDLLPSQVPQPDVYARPSMEDYYNPATLVNTPVNPPMDYYQASASPLDTLRTAVNVFNPFSNNSVWGTAYTPETADQLPVYYDFNQLGVPKWANDAFWSEAYRPSNYFTRGTSGLARRGLNAARNVAENTLANIGLEGLNKVLPENVAIPLETVGGLAIAGRAGYKGIKAGINELRDESRLTARAAETAGKEAAEAAKQVESLNPNITKSVLVDFTDPDSVRSFIRKTYIGDKSIPNPTPEEINAQTFYHGSQTSGITQEALTSEKTSPKSLFGPGIYMSNDPLGAPLEFTSKYGPIYESKVNVKSVLDLDAEVTDESLQPIVDAFKEHLDSFNTLPTKTLLEDPKYADYFVYADAEEFLYALQRDKRERANVEKAIAKAFREWEQSEEYNPENRWDVLKEITESFWDTFHEQQEYREYKGFGSAARAISLAIKNMSDVWYYLTNATNLGGVELDPAKLNQVLASKYDALTHKSYGVGGGINKTPNRSAPNTNQVLILLEPQNKSGTVTALKERLKNELLPEIGAIEPPGSAGSKLDIPKEQIKEYSKKVITARYDIDALNRKEKFVDFVESSIVPAIRKASEGKPLSENNLDSLANELKNFYYRTSAGIAARNGIDPYMRWINSIIKGFNNEQGNGFSMFRDQEFAQQILRELYGDLNDYKPQSRLEKLRSRLGK